MRRRVYISYVSENLGTKIFLCNKYHIRFKFPKRRIQNMTSDTVEAAKADAKKGIADAGKVGAYAKADANADVEKIKASFGKSDVEKKVAYATADIKADAKKANADAENKVAHAKADLDKAKAGK
jgi:hypothetical protein